MIEKIAKMLGVELYEEFKIKPTKRGYEVLEKLYKVIENNL